MIVPVCSGVWDERFQLHPRKIAAVYACIDCFLTYISLRCIEHVAQSRSRVQH